MCVSWHLELMISQLPQRQCILSHQWSMTITFNIIIYTHIIPRDRLSIGCLTAISHPSLIANHPHFFMLRYVTLRGFAGQNRSSCEISFLSFSECLFQGEILWYCHRHNVHRLKREGKKKKGNEIKWILSYLSKVYAEIWITMCFLAAGGNSFKAISSWCHERNDIFLRKCRLTGT